MIFELNNNTTDDKNNTSTLLLILEFCYKRGLEIHRLDYIFKF